MDSGCQVSRCSYLASITKFSLDYGLIFFFSSLYQSSANENCRESSSATEVLESILGKLQLALN